MHWSSAVAVLTFSRNPCATSCAVAVFVAHFKINIRKASSCSRSFATTATSISITRPLQAEIFDTFWTHGFACRIYLQVFHLRLLNSVKTYMVFALTGLLALYLVLSGVVYLFSFCFLFLPSCCQCIDSNQQGNC